MQSAKSLQAYGLDKFGITVLKPSTCFASKVTRFTDKQVLEKHKLPGPGSYEAPLEIAKSGTKKRQGSPLRNPETALVPYGKNHPPSIPSHDFVFGYEEEGGELIR
jgi:hypothetical protein